MDDMDMVLYTASTANGFTPVVLLEELKAAYPEIQRLFKVDLVPLSVKLDDIGKVHYHVTSPWFKTVSPNGCIPAMTAGDFNIFETSAILLFLVEEFDQRRLFGFCPKQQKRQYNEMLQWILFAHGNIVPIQKQASHFKSAAPEKIEYAIDRYTNETRRHFNVLNVRLENRDYLVGDKYTVADIKTVTWVRRAWAIGIDLDVDYPHVKAWVDRIEKRVAFQAALKVPLSPA